jgi:hypothetical protein
MFSQVNVALLDFEKVLCDDEKCPVGNEAVSYYFDDDHLSLEGSKLIESDLRKGLCKFMSLKNCGIVAKL